MSRKEQIKMAIIFIFPAFLVYTVFKVYPALSAFRLSLTDWDALGSEPVFIGLQNFYDLIKDRTLWNSLKNNILYGLITILVGNFIGMGLALILELGIYKGRNFFRGAFFVPIMLSWVVVGFLWRWIYNPVFGLLNTILKQINLDFLAMNWLGNDNIAFYSIVAVAIWKGFGFSMIIFSAGLQNIPGELLEAAKLDGGNRRQIITRIIIPLLKPIMAVVVILNIIDAFRVMDVFVVMVSSVQSQATQIIATYIFKMGFDYYRMGYAAALSVVLFLIVGTLAVTYFKTLGKSVNE